MGIITKVGDSSVSFSWPETELDEFIPLIKIISKKEKKGNRETVHTVNNGDYLLDTENKITLSKHINEKKRNFKQKQVITYNKSIKLSFVIEEGNDLGVWNHFKDNDGYIEPKISIVDENIKLVSDNKILKKYGESLDIEIEITGDENKEFDLEFYANDNEDTFKGEYENILCGSIKIKYIWSVCTEWSEIPPVIKKEKFIGWGHPGVKVNCYDYVVEQLKVSGYKVENESWRDWNKKKLTKSEGIYQLYLETDIAGMPKGVQKNEFKEGVKYLKKTLKKGIPIMVGVDDDYHDYNTDKTTEHFVTIVGMGSDKKGKFFLFYDNAISNKDIGTSLKNKLYCDCSNNKLSGKGDSRNTYIATSSKKEYIVTQIRKTK